VLRSILFGVSSFITPIFANTSSETVGSVSDSNISLKSFCLKLFMLLVGALYEIINLGSSFLDFSFSKGKIFPSFWYFTILSNLYD
jgi:hypothetical protein